MTLSTNSAPAEKQLFLATITSDHKIIKGEIAAIVNTTIYLYVNPTGAGYSYIWMVNGNPRGYANTFNITSAIADTKNVYVIIKDGKGNFATSSSVKISWDKLIKNVNEDGMEISSLQNK